MDANPITEFDEARSLQLLGTVSLGRLVTVSEGRADIFPVNYALLSLIHISEPTRPY